MGGTDTEDSSSDSEENGSDSEEGGSDKDGDESSSEESDDSDDRGKSKKKKSSKSNRSSPRKQQQQQMEMQPPPQQQQPAVVQQQQGDLLDDILNMGISSTPQQPPQQQQQNQMTSGGGMGGGGLDLFDFDDVPTTSNNNGGYNGPPLSMAFDGNKGQGLEMSLGFKQENGSPMMVVQAVNRSNNAISRIDIKFNKNYLGIQPTSTVPLNGQINPGQTQTVSLPLQLSQPPTPKNPLDLTVQMAARSIRTNTAKPPVTMFAVQIPAEIFFDSNNPNTLSDRGAFLAEWRAITEDQSQTIKQCKNTDVERVKGIFMGNSCGFVADRQIPNRECLCILRRRSNLWQSCWRYLWRTMERAEWW